MTAIDNPASSRLCVTRSPSGLRLRASQIAPSDSAGLYRVPEPVLLGVSVEPPGDEVYRIRGRNACLLVAREQTSAS